MSGEGTPRRPTARPGEPRGGLGPPGLQRGIIILPSAFTLGNLFFGVWSLVEAHQGNFVSAGWFIVLAGVADLLDGRIARFTRTGTAFGSALDSLVDAVSFGVAPGFLMYALFLTDAPWSWLVAFLYVGAVVARLARFNVEQAGRAKTHFHGLPSPATGMLLASYVPFSGTEFFAEYMAVLPWPRIMVTGMVVLSILMLSHIPYAVVPKFGFGSLRRLVTLAGLLAVMAAVLAAPGTVLFPLLVAYVVWALVKAVVLGFVDRLPDRDPLLDVEEDPDEADAELREIEYGEVDPEFYGTGEPGSGEAGPGGGPTG